MVTPIKQSKSKLLTRSSTDFPWNIWFSVPEDDLLAQNKSQFIWTRAEMTPVATWEPGRALGLERCWRLECLHFGKGTTWGTQGGSNNSPQTSQVWKQQGGTGISYPSTKCTSGILRRNRTYNKQRKQLQLIAPKKTFKVQLQAFFLGYYI